MTTAPESESIVGLGREIADDAVRLVRAEVDLAKARLKETAVALAVGAGLIVVALLALFGYVLFALGTVNEGSSLADNWPFFAAIGAAILGGVFIGAALRWGRLAVVAWVLGVIGLLSFVGLTLYFFVGILAAESPRQGWAISAVVMFSLMIVFGSTGSLLLIRAKNRGFGAVEAIKEDAEWVKHLSKRNKSES